MSETKYYPATIVQDSIFGRVLDKQSLHCISNLDCFNNIQFSAKRYVYVEPINDAPFMYVRGKEDEPGQIIVEVPDAKSGTDHLRARIKLQLQFNGCAYYELSDAELELRNIRKVREVA